MFARGAPLTLGGAERMSRACGPGRLGKVKAKEVVAFLFEILFGTLYGDSVALSEVHRPLVLDPLGGTGVQMSADGEGGWRRSEDWISRIAGLEVRFFFFPSAAWNWAEEKRFQWGGKNYYDAFANLLTFCPDVSARCGTILQVIFFHFFKRLHK